MGTGVEGHGMDKGFKERMKRGQEETWWTRTRLTKRPGLSLLQQWRGPQAQSTIPRIFPL